MRAASAFAASDVGQALWAVRRELYVVGAASALINLLMLTPTLYMLQLYDRVLVSYSELTLLAVSLVCLFLFALMALAEWLRASTLVHASLRLDQELGPRVFVASFDSAAGSTRPASARALVDLMELRQFISTQGALAFFDAPWVPIYIAVSFLLHPLLGFLAIAFAAIQLTVAWFGHRHTVAPAEAASTARSELGGFVQGKLRNAEVLESMGMVGHLRERWRQRHRHTQRLDSEAMAHSSRATAVSKFIRYAQQSLALGAGALLVIDGQLSAGGMIAANVLINRALAPIDMVVASWRSFVSARAAYQRLDAMLHRFPAAGGPGQPARPAGAVRLVKVTATAQGRPEPILRDVHCAIPAGSVVAISGASGSGKSTLAQVVLGIWPHVEGEVLLDGAPVAQWSRLALGPHIGYLPQEVELFDGTIAENIARFGEVDSPKIIAAARCAGLHEMILRFPQGYDTPIGAGGGTLSGGQRQRIGLARAVYGQPALIVLDEPNSNLDETGEAALKSAVTQLKAAGSTVFVISQRPTSIVGADFVLTVRAGQVTVDALGGSAVAPASGAQLDVPDAPLAAQPA
jgi:ATP-binding cassette subfamily C exporter for protease/lipase